MALSHAPTAPETIPPHLFLALGEVAVRPVKRAMNLWTLSADTGQLVPTLDA